MVISEEQKEKAEETIKSNEKIFDYRTSQWEVQHICGLLNEDSEFLEGDLFVPAYQRRYVWEEDLKTKFIESLLLNIPIPYIFISENKDASMEIIDWYQRIRTMYDFVNNKFKLTGIKKLTNLEWFFFSDLTTVRQKFFLRKVMNVIIFSNLEIDQKLEMFSRINTTAKKLNPWEVRKWTVWWDFYDFMKKMSDLELFKELCPINKEKLDREEGIELILRFFAYTEDFHMYKWDVWEFLTEYMQRKTNEINSWDKSKILGNMENDFIKMLNFVKKNFEYWFRKTEKARYVSSRVYFESISVWVGLAFKEKNENDLNVVIIKSLLKDKNYEDIIKSDWANALKKFKARINSVKEALIYWKLPDKLL